MFLAIRFNFRKYFWVHVLDIAARRFTKVLKITLMTLTQFLRLMKIIFSARLDTYFLGRIVMPLEINKSLLTSELLLPKIPLGKNNFMIKAQLNKDLYFWKTYSSSIPSSVHNWLVKKNNDYWINSCQTNSNSVFFFVFFSPPTLKRPNTASQVPWHFLFLVFFNKPVLHRFFYS